MATPFMVLTPERRNRYGISLRPCDGLAHALERTSLLGGLTELNRARRDRRVGRLTWYFDFVSPFSYLQIAGNPDLFQRPDLTLVPVLFAGLLRHFDNKGPAEI